MQPASAPSFKPYRIDKLAKRWIRRGRIAGLYRSRATTPLDPQRSVPPILVGALGGSGTRVIVELLVESGVFMGRWVDRTTRDALMIRRFLDRHVETLAHDPEREDPAIERDLHRAMRAHRIGIAREGDDWGWKNPRSMWTLPYLARHIAGMRFIHLVRDGRDLALSRNTFLLDRHGRRLLADRHTGDPLVDQFELWARGNVRAAEVSEQLLGPRALLVRYEDLCADPMQEIERLHRFIGRPLPRSTVERIAATVIPSPTLGRGRIAPSETLRACAERHAEALRRFGYATGDDTSPGSTPPPVDARSSRAQDA
jgi:hypothetical protein